MFTDMTTLLEKIAAELKRPRTLSARVTNHIVQTYGIDHDAVGRFLADELTGLDDYEIDLMLSPVFTPKLSDQAVFAELLGGNSVPREQWRALIEKLANRPTEAQLVTTDGRTHTIRLREVTIERYVHRLRLEGSISESILTLIGRTGAEPERTMLKVIARRAIWEDAGRSGILERYLTSSPHDERYVTDALALLNLLESHKVGDVARLIDWIPARRQALREQIAAASGPKPFFSQAVEDLYGGAHDQRSPDEARLAAKQEEFEFLERLQQLLSA